MATPHVAGLAALALDANPNLTPTQLRSLIVDTADQQIRRSDASGGINAARSVAQAFSSVGTSSASASASNAVAQTQSQVRYRFRNVDSASVVDAIVRDVNHPTADLGSTGKESDASETVPRRSYVSLIDDAFVSDSSDRRHSSPTVASASLAELALSESDFLDSLQEVV